MHVSRVKGIRLWGCSKGGRAWPARWSALCVFTGESRLPAQLNRSVPPPGYYYDLDDSYDESDEEEVRAHLRCVAEQPPLKLDTSSEVSGARRCGQAWGWAAGTHLGACLWAFPRLLGRRQGPPPPRPGAEWPQHKSFEDPRRGPWVSGSTPPPVVSNSFVFFPNLEARVFATFWLDHPTAEGGIADPEAEEAAADAERKKPVAPDGSEQAADAFAETGAVHPLQPRRDEQQPQLRGEEEVPDHLQPDPHQH